MPLWNELGTICEAKYPETVIAQIDMSVHNISVPGVVIQGYPTIYLFKKNGERVEYQGSRDIVSFLRFINKHK